MIRGKGLGCTLACLLLPITFCLETQAVQFPARGTAPIGTPAVTVISMSDGYTSVGERYNARITVLQTMRGEKAWDLVREASASNAPPKADFEYILARVKFEFSLKNEPANRSYILRENQFTAFSEDGAEYDPVAIVFPKPNLNGKVYAGDSMEGWVAFLVAQKDKKPVMTFSNSLRFQLY